MTLFVDGQLRNMETGEPFLFEVKKGKKAYNQAHYEALGEVRSTLGLLTNTILRNGHCIMTNDVMQPNYNVHFSRLTRF